MVLGTLEPLDPGTFGILDLSSPPPPGLVWFGMTGGGSVLTLEIEIDNWRWTFDLYIDVKKLWVGGWVVVELDYNVSSGPFLSYEIEIGDGPGPELDN